jgi:hypothetical protein
MNTKISETGDDVSHLTSQSTVLNVINLCAYCRSASELTKEHLLPAFLTRLEPDYTFGINERAGKFTGPGGTIKDVCRTCNTGPLSTLDAYAKGFYEIHGLAGGMHPDTFTISYDYGLLSRWLLKMAYNNLRTVSSGDSFRPYTNFIRKGAPLPNSKYLHIYLEVIRPLKLTDKIKSGLNPLWQDKDCMPSLGFRCAQMASTFGPVPGVFLVSLNAFHFQIFTFSFKSKSEARQSAVDAILPKKCHIFRLCPEYQNPTLKLSERDTLDTIEPRIAELQSGLVNELSIRKVQS